MKPGAEVMCLRNAGGRGTILDRATVTGYERREGRRNLVHIRYQDGTEDRIPDDRAYIVHAANLYPELVAALRDAERWLGVATIGNPATGPREAWERCRSMLAKCGPALDDERDAYPSGTVDDLERYPTAGSPWPGEAAKQ